MANDSARAILVDTLKQWGLDELTGDVDRLIKDGLDAPAITVQLQATDAYRKRFAANEIRRQKGLSVLSPAEYIAAEDAYQQVMRQFGLPKSFYDSREDFSNFIGNDVSPDELNQRASIAQQVWLSNDAGTRDAWRNFYGLSDGAAIASILDPDKALPIVQRMANAARFGGIATGQGLAADKARLETYSDMGVQESQIRSAFANIAKTKDVDAAIGDRFGQALTQSDREAEEILGNGDAATRRERLYNTETALFRRTAGADDNSLSRSRQGRY